MKVEEVIKLTNARLICGEGQLAKSVDKAFSSDLMSDILTTDTENLLIITGMSNLQLIRTAEMVEAKYILLVRNKKATQEMIDLATELRIVILETPFSMFRTSGILYQAGLAPVY
jgi:predicted transcriptional regulator